ncbi:hypothetical protein BDZ94DRAFT_1310400 [Collybia nuda]|uniref:Uncharacterized protein n=1 Tax=Collybia nuda TaxID=64659 RepID=A0A9P6CI98_9AGAR|nr:hypothetical protein BDZ94DRAFT_1310400 [Collybia nuda]
MAISSTQANIIGAIIELAAMGAYTVIFIDHLKIMFRRRSMLAPYIYLLCTSIVIFALSLVHAITDAWRDSWVRTVTYSIITLVSDSFFVYRVWIIWNKNYLICVVPFLLFHGDIATAMYLWWSLLNSMVDPAYTLNLNLVASSSKYFMAVTLALTLACTSYKLKVVERRTRSSIPVETVGHKQISKVITIIFESAALYSSLLVIMMILDILGIACFFIFMAVIPPVIGIVFSSIIELYYILSEVPTTPLGN